MNYKGTIIEESLANKDVLKDVQILSTKIEQVTDKHKTPWLKQWTLHKVEVTEETAQIVAEKLAQSLERNYWYADYKNDKFHYIIYSDKIFKIDKADPVLYKDAKQYGLSLGIPDYQADFAPDDPIWQR